jgi:small-conductance mechanosensitive channel
MSMLAVIDWSRFISPEFLANAFRALLLVCIGFPVISIFSRLCGRIAQKRFSLQAGMITQKAIFYAGSTLILVMLLSQLGFQLTALLGAAGIVGVAIGFASQTSVSNIISGLFLISEKPFTVGDVIKVGNTTGTVLSIDLLSVKVRTFDNQFVRMPNEMLIKAEVSNTTRFPIRRVDLNIGVAYKEDMAKVSELLKDIARKNVYCLQEPEPLVIFNTFGETSVDSIFTVWCVKTDMLNLKNSIMQQIKTAFDAEGIARRTA